MKVIKFSAARKRLRETLDECERTEEPVLIDSINNQMIIVSKKMFDEMNKKALIEPKMYDLLQEIVTNFKHGNSDHTEINDSYIDVIDKLVN